MTCACDGQRFIIVVVRLAVDGEEVAKLGPGSIQCRLEVRLQRRNSGGIRLQELDQHLEHPSVDVCDLGQMFAVFRLGQYRDEPIVVYCKNDRFFANADEYPRTYLRRT